MTVCLHCASQTLAACATARSQTNATKTTAPIDKSIGSDNGDNEQGNPTERDQRLHQAAHERTQLGGVSLRISGRSCLRMRNSSPNTSTMTIGKKTARPLPGEDEVIGARLTT
jgi:hypothetical protein